MAFSSFENMFQQVHSMIETLAKRADKPGSEEDSHLDCGIKGSDTAKGFEGKIPVLLSNMLIMQTGGGASGGKSGKANAGDYLWIGPIDASSPELLLRSLNGKPIDKATFTYRGKVKGEQKPLRTDTLEGCYVSLYQEMYSPVPAYSRLMIVGFQWTKGTFKDDVANVTTQYDLASAS